MASGQVHYPLFYTSYGKANLFKIKEGFRSRSSGVNDFADIRALPEPRETRDKRFVGRPLAQADIEAAAELWRHAYPEIYGSSHDFMLYPQDYQDRKTWPRPGKTTQ
jgi:hypothetical protein